MKDLGSLALLSLIFACHTCLYLVVGRLIGLAFWGGCLIDAGAFVQVVAGLRPSMNGEILSLRSCKAIQAMFNCLLEQFVCRNQ